METKKKFSLSNKLKVLISGVGGLVLLTVGITSIESKLAKPLVYCVNGCNTRIYESLLKSSTIEITHSNGEIQRVYDAQGFASKDIKQNYPSGECN